VAPATVAPSKFNVLPVQMGALLLNVGVAGAAFTTTFWVAVAEVHPFTTTYNE
jgi:hypothetical protein